MEPLAIAVTVGSIIALFIILDYSSPDTGYSHRNRERSIDQNAVIKKQFSEYSGTLLYAYGYGEYKEMFYIKENCSVSDILYIRICCSHEQNVCVIQESGTYNFVKAGNLITKIE